MQISERIDGVVIGVVLGFCDGAPLVIFPGNPRETALAARSLTALGDDVVGAEVALLFEDGDRTRPLVVGRLVEPAKRPRTEKVRHNEEPVVIRSEERIEIRTGKASIIMHPDGRIIIRGTHLVSHASAGNRIRGGSISLN